ncbi:MAG: pyridoxal 5'-phosphate synthase glutaminase subunit PdxT [Oligoflexia bacterium]|nr:pyridoxal 5'-phosphate synthase glutaminase subunit PdxT [Oligoflexia bacterium]
MKAGVLALQGDFEAHAKRLRGLGAAVIYVKKLSELSAVDGLALPGGESTAMLKLLEPNFIEALIERGRAGMPILATCAGVILLARKVTNPAQRSLDLLDIDVERNAYGRQVDSFVDGTIKFTMAGKSALDSLGQGAVPSRDSIEGVFIRAPRIIRTGPEVEVLAEHAGAPVLVRSKNILAATFHPELSFGAESVHQLFINSL